MATKHDIDPKQPKYTCLCGKHYQTERFFNQHLEVVIKEDKPVAEAKPIKKELDGQVSLDGALQAEVKPGRGSSPESPQADAATAGFPVGTDESRPETKTEPDSHIPAILPSAPRTAQTDMMIARQAQEVQVAMLAAKRFPRDEFAAMQRIRATCQRPTLAAVAVYSYPRGGQNVSGPSIRLAEALAQSWGNIDSGVIELDNRGGRSEMMAYAWDLETNTRSAKTFTVEHIRDTRAGKKDLTDGRDIYEATANFGARRMRACILSVIPGDVVEMAVQECRQTLAQSDKRPAAEIIAGLLKAFKDYGVTKEQLEKYLGKQLTEALKEELMDLRGVYQAIKDGQSKPSDYFGGGDVSEAIAARINAAKTQGDLKAIMGSLDVQQRKAAAPMIEAKMREVAE